MKLNEQPQIDLLIIGCVAITVGFLWLALHYPLIAFLIAGVCLVIALHRAEKDGKEWEKFQEKED